MFVRFMTTLAYAYLTHISNTQRDQFILNVQIMHTNGLLQEVKLINAYVVAVDASPAKTSKRVDLPQPDGPMMANTSCGSA